MESETLRVRRATDPDLLGLLSVKPDEILHRERLSRQERGEVTYLIAGDSRHPILGYVLLKWRGDERHDQHPVLEDLLVRPEFRGRGIGTRLLLHAEALCRERGVSRLGLGVNPTENPRALALYERLGYRDSGEPPHFDVYAYTDEYGQRRLYEDWTLFLVKDLTALLQGGNPVTT